jgi:hypothetical protein
MYLQVLWALSVLGATYYEGFWLEALNSLWHLIGLRGVIQRSMQFLAGNGAKCSILRKKSLTDAYLLYHKQFWF